MLGLALGVVSPAPTRAQESPASSRPAQAALNLNTATVDQLAALPGLGERMAQRIVEYRQKHGPFKKPEDLMNVKGIGEKNFLRLKSLVSATPPKTEGRPTPQS
jgi:competence protein ComEA